MLSNIPAPQKREREREREGSRHTRRGNNVLVETCLQERREPAPHKLRTAQLQFEGEKKDLKTVEKCGQMISVQEQEQEQVW